MNDHQQAVQLISELKMGKQVVLTVEKVSNFRKYLSELSKNLKNEYVTKEVKGKLLVIRIK